MNVMSFLPPRYAVTDNPLKTERRVELVFILLLIVLGAWLLVGFLGNAANTEPDPITPASDSLQISALDLEQPLTSDQSAALLARPLFWESRRPVEPVEVVVQAPSTPKQKVKKLDGIELHGVFGVNESLGIIATVDGKLGRIGQGDSVKGWRLTGFDGGVARFESGGRTQELPLAVTTPNVRVQVTKPSSDNGQDASSEKKEQGGGLTFGG